MPLYKYECRICGYQFEVKQGFDTMPITRCPQCEGKVRRVIGPVSLHLKGGEHTRKKMWKGRPIHQTEEGHWEQDGIEEAR